MSFLERLRRLLGNGQTPGERAPRDQASGPRKPISCMDAMTRLQEYLDGELEEASHEEVARHFSICQKCYPHLRLEERFRGLLRRSGEGENCPDELRHQVLDLLAVEAGEPG